jgi:RNase P/RNase MRP subunit POP5
MQRLIRAIADINAFVRHYSFNNGLTDTEKEAVDKINAALQLIRQAEYTLAIQSAKGATHELDRKRSIRVSEDG